MKKQIFLIGFLLSLFLFIPHGSLKADHRVALLQKKINEILHKTVIKELKLEGKEKEDVLKVLSDYDTPKVKAMDQLLHLKENLSQMEQGKTASETELATLIEKIKKINLTIQELEQQKVEKLKTLLTQEQISKYIIIHHKMMDKIKEALRQELQKSSR